MMAQTASNSSCGNQQEKEMSDADEQRFQREVMDELREEWEAEQEALEQHQCDGYAERVNEMADIRRKSLRENGK